MTDADQDMFTALETEHTALQGEHTALKRAFEQQGADLQSAVARGDEYKRRLSAEGIGA